MHAQKNDEVVFELYTLTDVNQFHNPNRLVSLASLLSGIVVPISLLVARFESHCPCHEASRHGTTPLHVLGNDVQTLLTPNSFLYRTNESDTMPVGPSLEAHCGRTLDEVVAISEKIRHSVLAYTNKQNLSMSDRLRRQLDMIRISADTILGTFTTASLTNDTLDDRIINWLFSRELPLCLGKLREIDNILKPISPVRPVQAPTRPFRPAEDKLTAATAFFDKHRSFFYFLLIPDVW